MRFANEPKKKISRRRFIVMAGAFGSASAFLPGSTAFSASLKPVTWTGSALGAQASIQLYHPDPVWAKQQLEKCQGEIDRLENIFSLYRPQSAVCRLNRNGRLDNPDIEFLSLLSQAITFYHQTDGLFDVTIQPLWELYAAHFSAQNADPFGPAPEAISSVLRRVGSGQIRLSPSHISFAKEKMALSFNGIAQGYITDRVTALLKTAGFNNVLVSLGENFALGTKPDGQNWRAGIVSPEDGTTILKSVDLQNMALATSGGYGSPFSTDSKTNHLLNPLTGKSAKINRSVSVVADTAVKADMASTVLSLMTRGEQENLVTQNKDIKSVFYL